MVAQTCSTNREEPSCNLRSHLRVDLFRALGDVSRVAILASLAQAAQPLRVTEIGTCCPQDLSVVSRHLRVLREAGVVQAERRGREVYYAIRWSDVAGMLREFADALEECCAESPGEASERVLESGVGRAPEQAPGKASRGGSAAVDGGAREGLPHEGGS